MRLFHFAAALTIAMSGSAWAQRFPDVDNRVPELRVAEVFQSGNSLKVTVQNVSTRTIRRVSVVLGKHKVDQDWSALAGGGVMPNATASLTISMAGLSTGGSRHHPAPLPPLELSSAVFADAGAAVVQQVPKVELTEIEFVRQQPPPVPLVKAKPAPTAPPPPPAPIVVKDSARVELKRGAPKVEVAPPVVAATSVPRVQTVPPAPAPAEPKGEAPRERAIPPPSEAAQQGQHTASAPAAAAPAAAAPPRPTGHAGTREQGVRDELSHLLSLIEPYETDLASPFPQPALRKMIAAVVAEQNAWAASQPAVTPYDEGQRSAVQTFAYGLQTIQGRRDLDDNTLREQVQRFLKNRRQSPHR